ncbi:MAG: 16S rRNA (uracil(1498)-N(3))-methyltransferase [Chloroflexi bacterium]|nr:16S rRNA (uracil(1498)-N(3))-methyltransferase [Chloroflexota bacterium]
MTLHRFFVDPADARGERFPLPNSIARQVRTVLRLRDGDRIVLLTGDGSEAVCRIAGDECVVEDRRPSVGEPAHRLTVVQALLKGDGLEEVVARSTEVGVAELRLAVTERCVPRDLSERKLARLRSIARESAEQAERGFVPTIHAPLGLEALLAPDAVMLFERAGADPRLGELEPPTIILVGPEGGFTHDEVDRARRTGTLVAGLGSRILRSQTVAPVAAALILSRTGDFA